MAGNSFSSRTGRVALGGVLAAGSLAVLWLACVVPSGQLGVTAAAGLFPVGAVLAAGRGAVRYFLGMCFLFANLLPLWSAFFPDSMAAPIPP